MELISQKRIYDTLYQWKISWNYWEGLKCCWHSLWTCNSNSFCQGLVYLISLEGNYTSLIKTISWSNKVTKKPPSYVTAYSWNLRFFFYLRKKKKIVFRKEDIKD